MDRPLVVIPCGSAKDTVPQPAKRLYTGSYFRACLRYATSVTTPDRVRILSAKHGLVHLNEVIAPYEQRMGRPGAVPVSLVRDQAAAQGLLDEPDVRITMGRVYALVALSVWPHATDLLAGTRGIGEQLQVLGENTRFLTAGGVR